MVIFDKINKFENRGSFEGWMKRITMFKAIDRYKNTKYIPVDTLEETVADDTLENEISLLSLDVLLQCIQQLPDQYRLVFNMYQLDGYPHKEVARILKISESSSKSNYHRAKQLLKTKITSIKKSAKTQRYGS